MTDTLSAKTPAPAIYALTIERFRGDGRWARYWLPDAAIDAAAREEGNEPVIPLSEAGTAIRDYVSRAPEARTPVGYDRKFLDRCGP